MERKVYSAPSAALLEVEAIVCFAQSIPKYGDGGDLGDDFEDINW